MNVLYKYAVQGILEANIREDGGDDCYKEIPRDFAIVTAVSGTVINIILVYVMKKGFQASAKEIGTKPKLWEKLIGILSILTVIIQGYYKFSTRKGMFMLNPCHINVLMMSYLFLAETSTATKRLYVCWEAWLFGPILSLVVPHLNGVDDPFQVFLYYLEHLLVMPIGPLLLLPRYGLPTPTFSSQVFGLATMTIYQYAVLTPASRCSKVNLNFTLCHTPADPGFDIFGYWYLLFGWFYLGVFSYITRLVLYPARWLLMWVGRKVLEGKQKGE